MVDILDCLAAGDEHVDGDTYLMTGFVDGGRNYSTCQRPGRWHNPGGRLEISLVGNDVVNVDLIHRQLLQKLATVGDWGDSKFLLTGNK